MNRQEEEAERIIELYYKEDVSVMYVDLENDICLASGKMTYKNAVNFAIIHVEGIIEENEKIEVYSNVPHNIDERGDYWEEVLTILKSK